MSKLEKNLSALEAGFQTLQEETLKLIAERNELGRVMRLIYSSENIFSLSGKEIVNNITSENEECQRLIEYVRYQYSSLESAINNEQKLVEERDALIAERKEMLVNKVFDSSDKKLLENHGFTDFIELLSAYEKLIAEREHYKIQHTAYIAEREQFLKQEWTMNAALKLAKDMFLANDLNLPRTLEVIDNALTKNEFSPLVQQGLAVFYGKMPESNGKENWTAILHRKSEDGLFGGIADGITIDRSEYPDRVRYEADRVRYLIGEIDKKPNILEYDSELHSGYVDPLEVQRMKQSATPIPIEELERVLGPDRDKYGFVSIKGEGYELIIDENRSVRGYPTSIGGVYFIFRNHDIEKHVPLSDEAIDAVLRIRTALEKGSEAEGMIHRLASHLMINNPKLPDEIINQIDSMRNDEINSESIYGLVLSSLLKPVADPEKTIKPVLNKEPFVWLWLHSYGKCAPTVFETKENAESAWGEFSPGGEAIPLFRESTLKPMELPEQFFECSYAEGLPAPYAQIEITGHTGYESLGRIGFVVDKPSGQSIAVYSAHQVRELLKQSTRVSKEWSEIWSPIEALVRPVTPLGQSVAVKAVELIKKQLSGAED